METSMCACVDMNISTITFYSLQRCARSIRWKGSAISKAEHYCFSGWWLNPTPLKNRSSSLGMMKFPTEWKQRKGSKPPTSNPNRIQELWIYGYVPASFHTLNMVIFPTGLIFFQSVATCLKVFGDQQHFVWMYSTTPGIPAKVCVA